ncbi:MULTISPECIES: aromatic ring-hydroxylating oxygenase subunit alpha [unclassified Nocardioides]|uniref:aromatic ring-hydroxylating oxygenase subunit alpha n=1 Tax=unclassified Nocardioides TaxID=2615069 RepID=UPI000702DEEC|nr:MULTISPECIES: aromatic ring-hydroxylating dioxygenase subunit alpha [unclassified Nocardioides]KRC53073.1 hypothetical protein ASE19_11835 [Nocardioides sp. Root79]KRC72602.1 hypothetical protein ASE20_08365 [Nocardioides sp. Root240]
MSVEARARRSPADEYTGPPARLFRGEEWFERDLAAIFHSNWLVAGHVDELDKHGKYGYITFRVGDAEVVVRRAKDGALRAYHNVCPHRGAQLCDGPSGDSRSRNVVCPYHQWTFDVSDGALLNSRHMHADFDSGSYGLRAAHVESWNGIIFVCFADTPPPSLAERLRGADAGGYDLSSMKLAATSSHAIAANWKIVVDNNMECYHCAVSHPELSELLDWQFIDDEESFDSFAAERAAGLDVFTFPFPVPQVSFGNKSVSKKALQRLDGQPAAQCRAIHWEPGIALVAAEDHAWLFVPVPIAPGATELRQYWFVHQDAVAGEDYDEETVKEFWNTTMLQDRDLCESVHRGMANPVYRSGPLNRRYQGYNAGFYRWYEQQMISKFPDLADEIAPLP